MPPRIVFRRSRRWLSAPGNPAHRPCTITTKLRHLRSHTYCVRGTRPGAVGRSKSFGRRSGTMGFGQAHAL
jgi:hypothetical protein